MIVMPNYLAYVFDAAPSFFLPQARTLMKAERRKSSFVKEFREKAKLTVFAAATAYAAHIVMQRSLLLFRRSTCALALACVLGPSYVSNVTQKSYFGALRKKNNSLSQLHQCTLVGALYALRASQ